jgi:hypothetical protein
MPDIARSLSISSINIVPYYYFPSDIGEKYKTELKKNSIARRFPGEDSIRKTPALISIYLRTSIETIWRILVKFIISPIWISPRRITGFGPMIPKHPLVL